MDFNLAADHTHTHTCRCPVMLLLYLQRIDSVYTAMRYTFPTHTPRTQVDKNTDRRTDTKANANKDRLVPYIPRQKHIHKHKQTIKHRDKQVESHKTDKQTKSKTRRQNGLNTHTHTRPGGLIGRALASQARGPGFDSSAGRRQFGCVFFHV